MKNKNLGIILISSLFLVIFSLMALATSTVSITRPVASADITGTVVLSATVSTGAPDNVTANLTWYYRTSSSAVWTWLGQNATNTSGDTQNATTYTITWDTSSLADGESYELNATIWNDTKGVKDSWLASDVETSIDVDNAVPSDVALTLDRPKIGVFKPVTFTCTATDAGDSATTLEFILEHPDSTESSFITVNATSNTGTHTFQTNETSLKGEHTAICQATDDAGFSTNSSQISLFVHSEDKNLPIIETETGGGKSNRLNMVIMITVIGVFILIVAGVLLMQKSKKGKRRRR